MSDNERHCPSVVQNQDGDMKCSHGHRMVHYFYLQDAQFRIRELEDELQMYRTLTGFKPTSTSAPDEEATLNHLRVEQSYGHVQLTLRGKTKLFTPKAIADLIRILKRSYNAANNYSPPAMIHCTNGIES